MKEEQIKKMKEIYDKVTEINKLTFKKEKEETIKNANDLMNEAERLIVCITEKRTLINGSPFETIKLLRDAMWNIVTERGIPKEIFEQILNYEEDDSEEKLKEKKQNIKDMIEELSSLMED